MAKVTNPTPTHDFGVKAGSNHTETITVYADSNTLADLSTWNGHAQWRDADGNLMFEMMTTDGTLTMTAQGQVVLFFDGDKTALAAVPDLSDAWVYDVKVRSADGVRKYTIVQGTTTVFQEVTTP
jgi:hypothetical protein